MTALDPLSLGCQEATAQLVVFFFRREEDLPPNSSLPPAQGRETGHRKVTGSRRHALWRAGFEYGSVTFYRYNLVGHLSSLSLGLLS